MTVSQRTGRKVVRMKSGRLVVHGTANAYSNHDCRCAECREAWRIHYTAKAHELGYCRPKSEYLASIAPDHGTQTMYIKYGCRCDACREGARQRRAETRKAARQRPTPAHVHGTTNGYQNWGCRCDRCRVANTSATKNWRAADSESHD